ncbi:MAG TPA: hypothetical protein VHX44_19565, partial [Planctomycetota bacterium]|nr:hypothetical protein [Planctomycetota bacterium]
PTLAAGWDGQIFAEVGATVSAQANARLEDFARLSSHLLLRLEPSQASDATTAGLSISVDSQRFMPGVGGYWVAPLTTAERAALLAALQITRNGSIIHPAMLNASIITLIARAASEHRHLSLTIPLTELAGMVPAGSCSVRLALPDGDEQALSNVLSLTIP